MSIASFWGTHRWSSRWGVVDAWHPTPHKGLDSGAGIHESIPFLRAGTIVEIGRSSSVGNYVVVQNSANDFDTYCHVLYDGIAMGDTVTRGQENMIAAGPNDIHGTSWDGSHCHYARGSTIDAWAYWPNLNPEEVVLEALGIAGSLPADIGTSVSVPRQKEVTMIGYNYNVAGGSFGSKVLADPVSMTYRYPIADELAAFEQSGGDWVSLNDDMWNKILGKFREIKKPDTNGVGSTPVADPGAIAAALAANPDFVKAIAASVKVPTAEQNGAAARAAIVK
jgi:hypothetical protein